MFNNSIRLVGNHARILKKYSKPTTASAEKREPFILLDTDGKKTFEKEVYIFETLIDCALNAAMLGIINGKKSEVDNSSNYDATIFADILNKRRKDLERIYQHMVLSSYQDLDTDSRIKKAFGLHKEEEKKNDLEQFLSFLRGGLEIIDDYFHECETVENLCNKIIDYNNEYNIDNLD